jgi:hypothetical protein
VGDVVQATLSPSIATTFPFRISHIAGAPVTTVLSGKCTMDVAGCTLSPNYPSNYGNGQSCSLNMTGYITSIGRFNTESCCDKLTVNGLSRSGTAWPNAIGTYMSASARQSWRSDGSVTRRGWKIAHLPTVLLEQLFVPPTALS